MGLSVGEGVRPQGLAGLQNAHGRKQGINKWPPCVSYPGATPLNEAAIKGLAPVAGLLLERHADATIKDNAGLMPIENAVRFHRNGVAELLLAAGKNAGTAGAYAGLLEEAVFRGYADTVEILLKHGADASARFRSGSTPLHDAALKGHDEIVRLLLAKGANVNARNGSGGTPLHDAALNGKVTTARILLARGADINAQETESGTTALYAAASLGRESVVALLLEKGADPNICSKDGASPLHAALACGNKSVADRIRAQGGRDLGKVER